MTQPTRSYARIASTLPARSVCAGLAAALAAACAPKKEAPKAAAPEVSVVEVVLRDVPIGGELTASLRGLEDVESRARVEGYLQSIDYREGSEVKKGQLLFTIDDQPYKAKIAEAKGELARNRAALSKADLDVSRFRPLAAERAVSQAELDNAVSAQSAARAQVDAAQASLEKATLDLGYTRVSAPIAGLIGRAQRKNGDLLHRPDPRQREHPRGAVSPLCRSDQRGDQRDRTAAGRCGRAARPRRRRRLSRARAPALRGPRGRSPDWDAARRSDVSESQTDPSARTLRKAPVQGRGPQGRAARASAGSARAAGPVLGGGGERREQGREPEGEARPAGQQPLDPRGRSQAWREGDRRGDAEGPRRHGGRGDTGRPRARSGCAAGGSGACRGQPG